MKKYKSLHIFDIDGTICNDGGNIKEEYEEILINLKEKGSILCFASARNLLTTKEGLNNNSLLLNNSYLITENGTVSYLNNIMLDNVLFSIKEAHIIKNIIYKNNQDIILLDYWKNNKLYTYTRGLIAINLPQGESNFRQYVNNLNNIINIELLNMVHCIFDYNIQIPRNISFYKNGNEYVFLPRDTNKSKIFDFINLKNIKDINIYGNGDNDYELFLKGKSFGANLYCIGNNKKLRNLADKKFSDYTELFTFLNHYT